MTRQPAQTPDDSADIDLKVETSVSYTLRVGVIASIALMLLGIFAYFACHPGTVRNPAALPAMTGPGAIFPHTLTGVLGEFHTYPGEAVIMAGLLVLIATPVLRVAISVAGFLRRAQLGLRLPDNARAGYSAHILSCRCCRRVTARPPRHLQVG